MSNTKLVRLSLFFMLIFGSAGVYAGNLSVGIPPSEQLDGSAPFDGADPTLCPTGATDTTINGVDCGAENLVVRTQDTVSTNFSVASNNGATNEVILVHTIDLSLDADADVAFTTLPAICLQTGVATPSSITPTVLTCNLGDFADGAQQSVTTNMLVSGDSFNGATFTAEAEVFSFDPSSTPDSLDQDTFTVSSSPEYDLTLTAIGPWPACTITMLDIGEGLEQGFSCPVIAMIGSEEPTGNAALESSLTYNYEVTAIEGSSGTTPHTIAEGFDFGMTSCVPNNVQFTGSVGGTPGPGIPAANSVINSGLCFVSNAPTDSGVDIGITIAGADTSGETYPTQAFPVSNGLDLTAGPYYSISTFQTFFLPFRAVDSQDGDPNNGSGEITVSLCALDFDPDSVGSSPVSNFGTGFEPGFNGSGNNCQSQTFVLSAIGSLAKWNWGFMRDSLDEGDDIISTNLHSGDGVVEPGQYYTAMVRFNNNGTAPLEDAMTCEFFDNTTQVISPVTSTNGTTYNLAEVARTTQGGFDFMDWQVQYTSIDTSNDNPQAGPLDPATNRYPGNWPDIMNARCDDAGLVWYDDPAMVPGGIDAINGVRGFATNPSTTPLNSGANFYLLMGMNARDNYYQGTGGTNSGPIPVGVIMPNFGSIRSSTINGGDWSVRSYDADTILSPNDGDRYTMSRAEVRLTKESLVPLAGVGDDTATAVSGSQIVWQLNPVVNSVVNPSTVDNVVVFDVLPPAATYDNTCTLATTGGVPADAVDLDTDIDGNPAPGFTRLSWFLGTVPANTPIAPLIFCSKTDALGADGTQVVNYAEIQAPSSLNVVALRSDSHTVTLEQQNITQIQKTVDNALDPVNDPQQFSVTWQNFSGSTFAAPVVIDVFSYNGDSGNLAPRIPGSNFAPTSTLQLVAAPSVTYLDGSGAGTLGTMEFTSAAPATISHDPNTNTTNWCVTPGSGGADCPATLADATAIRFTSSVDLDPQGSTQSGQILSYTLNASGNEPGDSYTNRAGLDSNSLAENQVLLSNSVVVEIEDVVIGAAKEAAQISNNGDGTFTVDYVVNLQNLGDVVLHDVQAVDDLTAAFGTNVALETDVDAVGEYFVGSLTITSNVSDPLTENAGSYNGSTDTNLLDLFVDGSLGVGQTVTLAYSVRFFPDIANDPYNNQVTASADTIDDNDTDLTDGTSDLSDDGTDPDPDGDGEPNEAGENDPTPLTLTFNDAPTLTKTFAPDNILDGGVSTMTLVLTNPNAEDLTGATLTDTYPSNVTNATPDNESNTCGGTLTSVDGGANISLSGGVIPANSSCSITVDVTSAVAGTYTNTTSVIDTANALDSATATDDLVVTTVLAPTLTKAFSPASIPANGVSTLTLTISNANAVPLTAAALTDTYPAAISNAAPNNITNTCGGSATANSGPDGVSLSGGTIPANGNCVITIDVTSATSGAHLNTTGVVETLEGPDSATASDTLTVFTAPTLTKTFVPNGIAAGGTSTMTLVLTNPNAIALTGAVLSDNYPAEISNASPDDEVNSCGGTLNSSDGASSISLSGGTIPASGSCSISVVVTSATSGTHTNTTSVIETTEAPNSAAATDDLAVGAIAAPTLTKDFATPVIDAGGTSVMTITLSNSNGIPLTAAALTDTYPVAITNATPANASTTCGGSLTATDGGADAVLSGATIPANSSCDITVTVTSSTAGVHTNTTGAIDTAEAPDSATASDDLTVFVAPTLSKAFSDSSIVVDGTTTMTLTITNANPSALTGLNLIDNFPVDLLIATPANAATDCSGGTLSTPGNNSLSLTGSGIAANSTCTITLDVTSTVIGSYTNTTGVVETAEAPDSSTASDVLGVTAAGAPTLSKTFVPDTIAAGATSTLTLTITNTGTGPLTNVALSDNYPSGLFNSDPVSFTNNCFGSVAAVAGGDSVALTNGILAPSGGTCTIEIEVTSALPGIYTNTSSTVTSTQAAPSATATDVLTVTTVAPTISKVFSPAQIPAGGTSTLTLSINNTNSIALTGMSVTDAYPAGLVNATPANATNSCIGGALTAADGANSIDLTGSGIAANSQCEISVVVTAAAGGEYTNTTSVVESDQAPDSTPASAPLSVLVAPALTKTFTPDSIAIGGTTTMTLTLTNSNSVPLTAVSIGDNYPLEILNATPDNESNTCGGTLTSANGGSSISMAGGTIPANSSCNIFVAVTSTTVGTHTNTTGVISSAEAPDSATASDDLVVTNILAPTISKVFSLDVIPAGGVSTMTLTIENPNGFALTGVGLTDNYPVQITNATPDNETNSCGGTLNSQDAGTSIILAGGSVPANSSCVITVDVTSTVGGAHTNTTSVVQSIEAPDSAVASDVLTVITAPTLTKTFTPDSIDVGGTAVMTLVLTNPNSIALTAAAVSDTYPTAITNATPNNTTSTCGGIFIGNDGGPGIVMTGGTIPANGDCSINIIVTSTTAGTHTNITDVISTQEAPDSATATDDLVVNTVDTSADLALTKDDGISSSQVGNGISYSLTVTNNGPQASGTGVTIVDTMPLGLTVNTGAAGVLALSGANAADWSCNSAAASPQVISCSYVGSPPGIVAGTSSTFGFVTDAITVASAGTTLTNNAIVSRDPNVPDSNPANNSASHTTPVDALAALTGTVWLDADGDDVIDGNETLLENWRVNVLDTSGNAVNDLNGNPATAVTGSDGTYSIPDLAPGTYTVQFISPNGVTFEEQQVTLPVSQTIDVPLPLDPSGVVYDAVTRQPVPGTIVTFIDDSTGTAVPPACLLAGQQNQVTGADGFYRFDLVFDIPVGSNPGCPTGAGSYSISILTPPGFTWQSTLIPAQLGALDATTCPGDALVGTTCEVQALSTAPQTGDATTYYLTFDLAPGDQDVVNNHIPLDPPPANIVLSKSANKRDVIIGDIVQYTLEANNDSSLFSVNAARIIDNLPPGFSYVPETAIAIQAGADGILNTGDDVSTPLTATGTNEVIFSTLNFDGGETILIRYLVSVTTGVSADGGDYVNTALVVDSLDNALSNLATATVTVTSDPLLEQTTIIGKVFHDRDGDGFQDNADATGLRISSRHFGQSGERLDDLPGRSQETDAISAHQIVVRMPYNRFEDNSFSVTSKQGSVINVDNDGSISYDHRGKVARGTTAQDLTVDVVRGTGSPTVRGRQVIAPAAAGTELLVITITNHGLHEMGIPGVRLATVEGLLIETDQFGRYHIAGVDTGNFSTGTNYIVKVDDATLPEGSKFTTENPRVQRLTQSLMTRFNFGVDLPDPIQPVVEECVQQYETYTEGSSRVVSRTLTGVIEPVRFASGKSQIPAGYAAQLQSVLASHSDKQNVRVRFVGHTDNERLSPATAAKYGNNQGLSESRARMVADVVAASLSLGGNQILTEGRGDTQPVASNASEAGMAQNRRVEIELIYDEVIDDTVEKTRAVGDSCDAPAQVVDNSPSIEYVTRTLTNAVEPVRFSSGKSQIPTGYIDQLRSVINGLHDKENIRIRFSGHTDNERLGPATAAKYGDNLGLSRARARQVADVIAKGLNMPHLPVSVEGYADTRPLASNATPNGMATNRRVEIEVLYDDVLERRIAPAVGGARVASVEKDVLKLPYGGVIWATEDPTKVDPRLDILASGPLVADGGRKIEPISFSIYSNYQSYISSYQITIYAEDDKDLAFPLTRLVGEKPMFDKPIAWDGYLQNGPRPTAGENLVYVLEVSDDNGRVDRTAPQILRVVSINVLQHEDFSYTDEVYGASTLVEQNIPLNGSRVRVYGQDIEQSYNLTVNGQKVDIGVDNNFVYEQQLPVGQHNFDVKVSNTSGETWDRSVSVTVDDSYLFVVAIANLTFGDSDIEGDISSLNGDHHFDEDVWTDGRIAAYAKGKFKGKYLVTAQIDTTEDDLDNIGDNLSRTDARSVFRRLDPDQHYSVYGDDSTTISDVDTQGAFYLRVDWDNNKALWGNYNTQITGTEYAQYNRSLYGAQFVHESLKTNDHGDHRSAVYAFASEAETANAHNEYRATGGSLYYLRETDIVRGSEKVWVEVRARDSERVVDLVVLEEGRDYQIDYLQGRIILNRPLTQVASQSVSSIIKDQALEGDDVFLAVDYEYVPQGFSGDDISAGVRGKGWLGDLIGVGGTYITEERSNAADYTLSGVDVTLKAGKGSWIKAEYAESESSQASSFVSDNGGLSFNQVRASGGAGASSGSAYSVEGHVNLAELSDNALNATLNAWYKNRDASFSSTRTNDGVETTDFGVEAAYENNWFALSARANQLERNGATTRTANLQGKVGFWDKWNIIGELRYEDSEQANANLGFVSAGDILLGAVGIEYKLNERTDLWGSYQGMLADSSTYTDNTGFTVGGKSQFNEHIALLAEVTSGDRGDAVTLGVDWSVSDNINLQLQGGIGDASRTQVGTTFTTAGGLELYGSYAVDTDRTDNEQERLTFGQSQRYGDGSRIFAEQQFTNDKRESGITNIFGVDHRLTEQMSINASLQTSSIESLFGNIERNTGSIGFDYKDGNTIKASSRFEFRDDSGAESTQQWLTTNALDWKQNDHLRWVLRLNLSLTENDNSELDDGQFIEADLGFAYRPVTNDRLNILGKYSYLYDLPASLSSVALVGQNTNNADQRMHIFSLEALYELSRKWEIGGKVAARLSETRITRGQGDWFDSGATLAAVRARYHMIDNWDALAEYHILLSEAGDDQREGALLALYRHVGSNFKVGVGYNFSDFTDDLRQTGFDGYNANGFFIDLTGKY